MSAAADIVAFWREAGPKKRTSSPSLPKRFTTRATDVQEAFIDGSFAPAKRGGACVGKTKRGKGSKIMAIADRKGLATTPTLFRNRRDPRDGAQH